jgi:hypothetical protein
MSPSLNCLIRLHRACCRLITSRMQPKSPRNPKSHGGLPTTRSYFTYDCKPHDGARRISGHPIHSNAAISAARICELSLTSTFADKPQVLMRPVRIFPTVSFSYLTSPGLRASSPRSPRPRSWLYKVHLLLLLHLSYTILFFYLW